ERERVPGEDRGDDLTDGDDDRDDEAVLEVRPEVGAAPRVAVRAELRMGREERRRLPADLCWREQRAHDRDVDREEHDDGEERQERVTAHGLEHAPAAVRPRRDPVTAHTTPAVRGAGSAPARAAW